MSKKKDLTGQPFGRLVVIKEAGRSKAGYILWKCLCECGNVISVHGGNLCSGHTQSCGCLAVEKARESNTKHGMRYTSTYTIWCNILLRCNNSNVPRYGDYGGRGIKVCRRWLKFGNFLEDMGERPSNLTIERRNNNEGYYKENCKWATHIEQARNQRIYKNNKTGTTGVHWHKCSKKYLAQIGVENKQINLGYFTDLEEAKAARKEGELKYWGKQYG